MDSFTQPPLSVGKLGSNRKRKAEDEEEDGRRVRSGAPPPALAVESGDAFIPLSARMEAQNREDGHSLRTGRMEHARALEGALGGYAYSGSPEDGGVMTHSSGHYASVKREWGSFEQEDERQRGASNQFQAFNSSLSPKMYGTPPRYRECQALPRAGYAKRKRGDGEDLGGGKTAGSSQRIYSKPTDAPSSTLQRELGPEVVVFSHNGLRLGQLLPCGEIVGFMELPPLAQLYDLYYLASIKPRAEHTWVHHTWQQIHKSAGIKNPSWQQNYWPQEIKESGVASKHHTIRAIKTFRELGEKIWRVPSSASFGETLNLLLKEMDYTVLLLLGHCHQDDRGIWSNSLKVLFERLDPALRPQNQLANLTNSTVISEPNAKDSHTETQPGHLPSDVPAAMAESLEHASFYNAWPTPILPSAPGSVYKEMRAVKEEQMDMM